VPISLLIVTKCNLGQEKKIAGATAGYLDNRNKFHLTRTSKHLVKSTEEDLSIVIERHANQVRNQETHTNIQKSTQLDIKKQSYRTKNAKGFVCTKTGQVSGGYNVSFNHST
jgi:hypothetical protein